MRTAHVNPNALAEIEMSRGRWKLFWTIVNEINPETSEVRISTGELATRLGRSPANVSAELRALIEAGLLRRLSVGVLEVNAHIAYRDMSDLGQR